jgi:hypothetical protein
MRQLNAYSHRWDKRSNKMRGERMFELYVRCPTTGEPVYAGFQLPAADGEAAPSVVMGSSICPACGATHEWQAAAVWLAIPMGSAPDTAPPFEIPSCEPPLDEVPAREALSQKTSTPEPAWRKVA